MTEPNPADPAALRARRVLVFRYWAWSLGITTGLLLLYRNHPYYVRWLGDPYGPFLDARPQWALLAIYVAYLAVIVTAPFRGDVSSSKTLLVAGLLESLPARLRRHLWGPQPAYRECLPIDAETRTALLSILVKAYFLPVMLRFLYGNLDGVQRALGRCSSAPEGVGLVWLGLDITWEAIFLVDTAIFAFGYAVEAGCLKNRIRSVEPTLFGWAVTLACYPPFNDVTSTFLPDSGQAVLIGHRGVLLAFRFVSVGLYLVYAWASVALGPRASNLTHRGIVTWGPYRYVRHPAYICKNVAWWFDKLPLMGSPVNALALLAMNLIYVLRALTEERHLSMDPDYVAYSGKVPYRFIPGVF